MEEVELGLAIGTIAEEADTDTLPITTTHREGIASRQEGLTIKAIEELMAIGLVVVVDPQIEPMEWAFFDDDVLTCLFEEDALRTEANALEEFARAEKADL
mgnify:CR=1 FL=1